MWARTWGSCSPAASPESKQEDECSSSATFLLYAAVKSAYGMVPPTVEVDLLTLLNPI